MNDEIAKRLKDGELPVYKDGKIVWYKPPQYGKIMVSYHEGKLAYVETLAKKIFK